MTLLTEKQTLFVVARRREILEKYGESIRVRNTETSEIKKKVPAISVRDIVVCGELHLDSGLIGLVERYKIPIHFMSTGGRFKATMVFDFSKNVFLRSKQFLLNFDAAQKLKLAKIFVDTKVKNQNSALQRIRAKGKINVDLKSVNNLDELRGVEGAVAQKYFAIWKKERLVKNRDFVFNRRVKRPPTDEINALLSFCFSLLYAEIHSQLMIAGLDPYIGYLHEQSFGHSALASDFLEIYRGPVENFVWTVLNRKEFDVKNDFIVEEGGSVRLSRDGFKKFFPKWADFLRKNKMLNNRNLTQLIELDIRKFANFLMEDEIDFRPFLWKK